MDGCTFAEHGKEKERNRRSNAKTPFGTPGTTNLLHHGNKPPTSRHPQPIITQHSVQESTRPNSPHTRPPRPTRRPFCRKTQDQDQAEQNSPRVQDASVVGPAEASAVRHDGLGRHLRELRPKLVNHHLGLQVPDLTHDERRGSKSGGNQKAMRPEKGVKPRADMINSVFTQEKKQQRWNHGRVVVRVSILSFSGSLTAVANTKQPTHLPTTATLLG